MADDAHMSRLKPALTPELQVRGITAPCIVWLRLPFWHQLFEGWIMLSTRKIAIQWISVNKTNHATVYPFDSDYPPFEQPRPEVLQ